MVSLVYADRRNLHLYGSECEDCGKELNEFGECEEGHTLDDKYEEAVKKRQLSGTWIRYQSHEGPL